MRVATSCCRPVALLTAAILIVAILAVAILAVAILAAAIFTVAILTVATFTVATLTAVTARCRPSSEFTDSYQSWQKEWARPEVIGMFGLSATFVLGWVAMLLSNPRPNPHPHPHPHPHPPPNPNPNPDPNPNQVAMLLLPCLRSIRPRGKSVPLALGSALGAAAAGAYSQLQPQR